jgi:hypothetical protein
MDRGTKRLLASSLTTMLLSLPGWLNAGDAAQAEDKSATGAEAMYCRPPQDVTGSRLKGPKVCLTVGRWKELHAQGLDVSADGSAIVPLLQKQMEAAPGLSGLP